MLFARRPQIIQNESSTPKSRAASQFSSLIKVRRLRGNTGYFGPARAERNQHAQLERYGKTGDEGWQEGRNGEEYGDSQGSSDPGREMLPLSEAEAGF